MFMRVAAIIAVCGAGRGDRRSPQLCAIIDEALD